MQALVIERDLRSNNLLLFESSSLEAKQAQRNWPFVECLRDVGAEQQSGGSMEVFLRGCMVYQPIDMPH